MNVSDKKLKCGFIGLGSQGAPIAKRMLDGGFSTALWARRQETLSPFRSGQGIFATAPELLAETVDYVGICVSGDDTVVSLCNRLIPHMNKGSYIVVHSTVLPSTCEKLSKDAQARGLHLVDAPVSGGGPAAAKGELTVMVGSDPRDLSAIRPVLETFASRIFHMGSIGSGQKAKLINNALMAGIMGLTHSAVKAGVGHGLARESFIELLSVSSANSFALDVYSRIPESGQFHRSQTLLEKVSLFSQVFGEHHPTSKALSEAAHLIEMN